MIPVIITSNINTRCINVLAESKLNKISDNIYQILNNDFLYLTYKKEDDIYYNISNYNIYVDTYCATPTDPKFIKITDYIFKLIIKEYELVVYYSLVNSDNNILLLSLTSIEYL